MHILWVIMKIAFLIMVFVIFSIIISSCITIKKEFGGYEIRRYERLSENPNIRAYFSLGTEGDEWNLVQNVLASFYFSVNSDIQVDTFEFVAGYIQAGKQKISLDIERMNRGVVYVNENNRIDLSREFVNLGSSEVLNEKINIHIEFKINNENYTLKINEANLEIQYRKKTLANLFVERFFPIRW